MYPYILLSDKIKISKIFGNQFTKVSFVGMDDDSDFINSLLNEEIYNQSTFQQKLQNGKTGIIISGYLEKRKKMFVALGCEQMVNQERFYHLGLDLSAPLGTKIFVPLDGIIYEVGYEEGNGNYGGYIIIEHIVENFKFYSFYGHLSKSSIRFKKGDKIDSGELLGNLGDFHENGGYFYHLHLQIITDLGMGSGYKFKGYCTKDQLEDIRKFTPDPSFLFKF